jgi:hypothetical protein
MTDAAGPVPPKGLALVATGECLGSHRKDGSRTQPGGLRDEGSTGIRPPFARCNHYGYLPS